MTKIIFTCEHASNAIPPEYRAYFRGQKILLQSHRGWDEGARDIAAMLAKKLRAPLVHGNHSRLLADLNRTPENPGIFSECTRAIAEIKRNEILRLYHAPHWKRVRHEVTRLLKSGEKVIHVGVHTFTPVLHGHRRKTEIGLLYDPSRVREEDFCLGLQKFLRLHSNLAVHRNLPYRGTGNGLVMALRKEFPLSKYLGLELEINQRLLGKKREIAALIGTSLQKML